MNLSLPHPALSWRRGRRCDYHPPLTPAMKLPGTGEILLILLLCVVVFTASKVNPMGDALGALFRRKPAPKTNDKISIRPVTPPEDTGGSSTPG